MGKESLGLFEKPSSITEVRIQEPKQFRVLMHNDHYTTMDFVVQVLGTIFNKPPVEAIRIMLTIHHQGTGVCGTYTAEVAETKVHHVHLVARENGYPLRCSLEEV
jgi:ATP-dependent Clp protease adaptor protein ClpS